MRLNNSVNNLTLGDTKVEFISINAMYLSEVERLFRMLQENEFAAPETKSEIELTIQAYMKQIREFRMRVE